MITFDETPKMKQGNTYKFSFVGLSTDAKPVEEYKGFKIANGSTFIEMDTRKIKFYDEGGKSWV